MWSRREETRSVFVLCPTDVRTSPQISREERNSFENCTQWSRCDARMRGLDNKHLLRFEVMWVRMRVASLSRQSQSGRPAPGKRSPHYRIKPNTFNCDILVKTPDVTELLPHFCHNAVTSRQIVKSGMRNVHCAICVSKVGWRFRLHAYNFTRSYIISSSRKT